MQKTPTESRAPHPARVPDAGQPNRAMWVRTLLLVSMFLIFGFGLLVYQLYALQIRDPESFRADAAEQQLSDQTLPAARGSIYSATGKLLAKSSVVWNVIADPSKTDPAVVEEASAQIASLGVDVSGEAGKGEGGGSGRDQLAALQAHEGLRLKGELRPRADDRGDTKL